nr:MAG: polysaccharide biosynthesis protein [Pseudomonadota bacterium]
MQEVAKRGASSADADTLSPARVEAAGAPAAVADEAEPSGEIDDAPNSLRRRMSRASMWSLAGYGIGQMLRLAGNLVLWRLLYPEAFGLMALINVLMQGMAMFSDVGIGPSIIQNRRGEDPDYLNTAWTIQVVRGTLLFIVGALLAAPVADFYDAPELRYLFPLASIGFVIDGFTSTRLFTAERNMALGRLTAIDLLSQVVALVGTVGWALVQPSPVALVFGPLVANVFGTAMSFLMLPGVRNRLRWDRECARTLLTFGRWVFLSTLLGFAASQADRLVFGKLVPMELLGVYNIALVWASMPNMVLERIFRTAMFPALSKVHNADGDLVAAFREAREPWLLFGAWVAACLLAGGPFLIRLMYDARALDAGWIVQLLAVGTWVAALSSSRGNAALARGAPGWIAAASAAKVVALAVLIPTGVSMYGFPGGVAGFVLAETVSYSVLLFSMTQRGLREFPRELVLTALIGASAFVAYQAASKLGSALATYAASGNVAARISAFAQCALVALVTGALFGPLFLLHRAHQKRRPSALRG